MKQMMIALAVIVYFSSCTQVAGWVGSDKDSAAVQTTDSLNSEIIRDVSINEGNAYSDLFLDSASIESFIQKEKMNDTSARMLRNFYAVRNNQFAWFNSDGLTGQARGLWSLYSSEGDSASKDPGQELKEKMDTLLLKDSITVSKSDSSIVHTELVLTQQLIQYASEHPNSTINNNTLYYLIPAKRLNTMELADSILNRQKDSAQYAGNKAYAMMKQQLAIYYQAAKNGNWQTLTTGQKLKKGTKSPTVTALKKRLQASGDYAANDTSNIFSDTLELAIKDIQERNGLLANGVVNDSLINVLNVPAEERIRQIIVNMDRMLWMQPVADSNRIQVNIPSLMLYTYEGSNKVFEMPVIVGKEGTNTVMFSGNIDRIVFNPDWNIPQSIVKNEIMPAMKSDPDYLKKNHMEIVKQNDSLPVIRQLPGKDNPLGRVKFLFPNSYDIYLHDTPDKTLFKKADRTLSHGCIRVADAKKLTQYLLRGQSEWTEQKINSTMSGGKEQTVSLNQKTPVSITYLTAWVDEKGRLNFRNDVYGHDKNTMEKMFLG